MSTDVANWYKFLMIRIPLVYCLCVDVNTFYLDDVQLIFMSDSSTNITNIVRYIWNFPVTRCSGTLLKWVDCTWTYIRCSSSNVLWLSYKETVNVCTFFGTSEFSINWLFPKDKLIRKAIWWRQNCLRFEQIEHLKKVFKLHVGLS